jgi:predicted transcriptional regulator
MTATQTKLIMYYEIHRLHIIEGMSVRGISKHLVCDRRTVSKYLSMNETEYFEFLEKQRERNKLLTGYEPFVYSKLDEFKDTSAAQMHDWLKERYPDFHNTLKVNRRTDIHENIRPEIKTMSSQAALIAMTIPNRSSIDDYQNAFIINK